MKHEAGCIGNRRMAVRVEAECAALCSEVGERQGNMMLDVLAVRAKAECAALCRWSAGSAWVWGRTS